MSKVLREIDKIVKHHEKYGFIISAEKISIPAEAYPLYEIKDINFNEEETKLFLEELKNMGFSVRKVLDNSAPIFRSYVFFDSLYL